MSTELMTRTDVGALNARRLADAIVFHGAISRAQLARDCGLSKPTVSMVLARLVDAGLVHEVGRTRGGRGATALLYDIAPDVGCSLALDVGRSWVRARVLALGGRVRSWVSEPTRDTAAPALAEQIVAVASRAIEVAAVPRGRIAAATLGVPGVVTADGEQVRLAPAMPGLRAAPVIERLEAFLGIRVQADNDVNLAARAELAFGHGREHPDFVLLAIGTGVGLALMLDGQLRSGATGSAGELAHLLVPGGLLADARARGVLAATAQEVIDAGRAGHPPALEAIGRQAQLVAAGVANVCAIVDPGLVVIGGDLGMAAADVLLPLVQEALRGLTPLRPTIVASALNDLAVLDGASVDAVGAAQEAVLGPITGHRHGSSVVVLQETARGDLGSGRPLPRRGQPYRPERLLQSAR